MNRFETKLGTAAAIAAGLLLFAGGSEARANILLTAPSVTGSAPNFTWSYTATVSSSESVNSTGIVPGATTPGSGLTTTVKDYFTLYDFYGFTGVETHPAGWAFVSLNTGSTPTGPGGIIPNDNPAIPNLTWYYTGANEIFGLMSLGVFTANSITGAGAQTADGFYGASDTNRETAPGMVDNKITALSIPAVPEPASMTLLGTGLLGLIRSVRRRKIKI